MGVAWALVWAPVGVLSGLIIDPDGSMDEMWILIGAYPGFVGGVLFSLVLLSARGRHRLDKLSIARVGAWGAAAGLAVGILPFMIGTATSTVPLWLLAGGFAGVTTALSATSAAGSVWLAQRAIAKEQLAAPEEPRALR